MKGECSQADCGAKDGLTCEFGFAEFSQCPHFGVASEKKTPDETGIAEEVHHGQRLPWTGRALGLSDMMLASARSSATLVGLIGPHNAGKTAFLTSVFAHFAKSGIVGSAAFAGSYTLQAWSTLKHYTEWPTTSGSSFPPHTPDTGERVPSLLHLAFRQPKAPICDVLFTDAPGEWFTRWINNQSSESSKGARWIAENATHFLFFVDRDALAGEEVGKTRQHIQALARILSEQRRDRPIIVIWAKSDKTLDLDAEAPVREKLQKLFGDHPAFEVHVEDPICLEVLSLLLKQTNPQQQIIKASPAATSSAFLAYTGNHR